MKRLHVIYHGKVQGVGFRFTVMHIAVGLNLTGWVRNKHDGSVEITSEGAENKLHAFMSQAEDSFTSYIGSKDVEWQEATGEFSDFRIAH
ncbi:MAG: acylphosphatase [Candidatus Omnitrophota bacterium]|nr:acylphosphatase [Candidatus Omnitrophota bacterium]